jgi:hypothetical protein
MRVFAAIVFACLVLAGTGYYLARPNENARLTAIVARLDQLDPPPDPGDADTYDLALVKKALDRKDLTEAQAGTLIEAAGRRYIRRKLAYAEAQQLVGAGKAALATLEPLRREMDMARRVVDLAESMGPRMARAELELERRLVFAPSTVVGLADRYDGTHDFTDDDLKQLKKAYLARFGKPLPISALGDSAWHRRVGFNHQGRIDVAVSAEQPEGVWLRQYLVGKGVSFFAFRTAVPGVATGAHIHIGPASGRRARGD